MIAAQESASKRLLLCAFTASATLGLVYVFTSARQGVAAPFWLVYVAGAYSVASFSYLFLRLGRKVRARAAAIVAGREALTACEFATRYFSGDAIPVAARCHELFAAIYDYDSSRITADDRLCADLGFATSIGLQDIDLVRNIEREFKITFSEPEAQEMLTMRDIVMAVCRKQHKNKK